MKELFNLLRAYRSPNVFNPWVDVDPLDMDFGAAARRRCERLAAHFYTEPELLLIGEAPGYQGCHFSGVPFTNEALILDNRVPRIREPHGRFTLRTTPWSEPSATIVWGQLHELGIAETTVLWNAFAWHPHKPGNLMSNRAPTPVELLAGATVLRVVCSRWPGVPIVAVGKIAQRTLGRLGIRTAACVRHPAMGGATEFRAQLTEFVRGSAVALDP